MDPNERRYEELLSLALDGACSDAEREEFSRLEQENPELALQFVEAVFTHTLLQWQARRYLRVHVAGTGGSSE